MSVVGVLFHCREDDQAGELNRKLDKRGLIVDSSHPICCIEYSDGWLVICHDQSPTEEINNIIREKSDEAQRRFLLIHQNTDSEITSAQEGLRGTGGPLEFARCYYYSHVEGSAAYNWLLKALAQSQESIAETLPSLDPSQSLEGRLFELKEHIGNLFAPVLLHLEVWRDLGFSPACEMTVVETYERKALYCWEVACDLIHTGAFVSNGDSVQGIIKDANFQEKPAAIASIEELIPADSQPPAWDVLRCLHEDDLNLLRQYPEKVDQFEEWYLLLTQSLADLKTALKSCQ